MGLTTLINRQVYVGDGSSTIFPFPYYFFADTDLSVFLYDTTYSNSSFITQQSLSFDYTVSGTKNSQGVYIDGANVVVTSAFPSTTQIIIVREPPLYQNFYLAQNQSIPSASLTKQLDYLTALTQRLQDELDRSVKLPDGLGIYDHFHQLSTFDPTLPQLINNPTMSPGMAIVVNSGASGFTLAVIASSAAGSSGTVTSVDMTVPSFLSVAGNPITTAGTLAVTLSGLALPVANGGTGQVRALVQGQIVFGSTTTSMGMTTGGTVGQFLSYQGSSAPTWASVVTGSISLTTGVIGVLPVPNGGTGVATLTAGGVLVGSGASNVSATAAGLTFSVLQGSTNAMPAFTTQPTVAGVIAASSIISVLDSSATIGLVANSSGQRFGAIYAVNDIVVGTQPGTSAFGYVRMSKNVAPGPNVGIAMATANAAQGYGIGTDGNTIFHFNIGGNQRIFTVADHFFAGVDNTTGNTYMTCSTANATSISVLTVGKNTNYSGILELCNGFAGGQSVKIANSGTTTGYTVYWPAAQGGVNQVLTNDGAGGLTWTAAAVTGSNAPLAVAAKTANYNAVVGDDFLVANSGCNLVNLYAPSGNTGRSLRVMRGTSPGVNDFVVITCSAASATVVGSNYFLGASYDSVELLSDGTNWLPMAIKNSHAVNSCNPTFIGFGVVTSTTFYCQKLGSNLRLWGTGYQASCNASTASMSLAFAGSSVSAWFPTGTWIRVGSMRSASTQAAFGGAYDVITSPLTPGVVGFSAQASARNGKLITESGGIAASGPSGSEFTVDILVPILNWM